MPVSLLSGFTGPAGLGASCLSRMPTGVPTPITKYHARGMTLPSSNKNASFSAGTWVRWRQYLRGWLPVVGALMIVFATSFLPGVPSSESTLYEFTNEDAKNVVKDANLFAKQFPSREAGTPGAVDSAQFIRDQFTGLGLTTRIVTGTADGPRGRQVSVVNVEALLPGRTDETVVVRSSRDNLGGADRYRGAADTMLLPALAEEISNLRDRRRTWLFISTDASLYSHGGDRVSYTSKSMSSRRVVAEILLDNAVSGVGEKVVLPFEAVDGKAPNLGFYLAGTQAVDQEGLSVSRPGISDQFSALALPALDSASLPAIKSGVPTVHFSIASEPGKWVAPTTTRTGDVARSVVKIMSVAESVDSLPVAGKTWVLGSERAYRGWAIKILIASLLCPIWVALTSAFVRSRRVVNMRAASETVIRVGAAALLSAVFLKFLSNLYLRNNPLYSWGSPNVEHSSPILFFVGWTMVTAFIYSLMRGPDWRVPSTGPGDVGRIILPLLLLTFVSGAALALNPYFVIMLLPSIHIWLWVLQSPSSINAQSRNTAIVVGGFLVTLFLILHGVSAQLHAGFSSVLYLPLLAGAGAMGGGVVIILSLWLCTFFLVLATVRGRGGSPAITALRKLVAGSNALMSRNPRVPYSDITGR